MIDKEDGGQAFPCAGSQHGYPVAGMTLRDFFAIKVAAAWIVAAPTLNGEDEEQRAHLSSIAYAQADSMLVERAK